MSIFFREQKGVRELTGIAKLAFVSLFTGLAFSVVSTIWAVYLNSFVDSIALVGFVSSLLSLLSFLSFLYFIPIVEKREKSKLFAISVLLIAICYLLFAVDASKFWMFLVIAIVYMCAMSLRIMSIGIMIRDQSSSKQVSRNEGLVYTSVNIAWLIGPLIAGIVAVELGIGTVFTLAAIFLLISLFLFKFAKVKDGKTKKKVDGGMLKNFTDFFKKKDRIRSYILGGGVGLWWTLIFIYMPLYIIKSNLNDLWIGYFLFGTTIPLVLLEYYFGKLTGKIGFRKIFKIGFLIPAVLAFACFFVSNIYAILLLLSLASIGLAMVEPTTEAHFFDILKGNEKLRFYGVYSTRLDVNNFASKILASSLLLLLPFKFVFLLYSVFMLVLFLISFKVKNVVEARR